MTSTAATKTISVQIPTTIQIEVEVEDTSTEAILDACWKDLKDPNSKNDWQPTYDNLKEAVRGASEVEGFGDDLYQLM